MVPVAANEVGDVTLGPLVEVLVVALRHLADGPLVEGLRHDQEAHPVAQVEELGRGRIVRGADGVGAHRLQHLEPALPDPLRHGRAEPAGIVMQVDAPHLDPPAVQQEAAVLVVRDGADAERRGGHIGGPSAIPDTPSGACTASATPPTRAAGVSTCSRCSSSTCWPAASEKGVSARATSRPALSSTTERSTPRRGRAVSVLDPGADHAPPRPAESARGRRHVGSPVAHVQRVDHGQPDMAVDAAAGVPAGVGLPRVVHPHRDHVDARHQVPGDVVREADVAVGPAAQVDAVDPDVAVHVHAVELEPRHLAPRPGGQPKRLAIPADARGEVAHAAAARGVLAWRALDAPVVRQVEPAPLAVVEPRLLGSGVIAEEEAPAGIHGETLSLGGDRRRGRGQHDDAKQQRRDGADDAHVHWIMVLDCQVPGLAYFRSSAR